MWRRDNCNRESRNIPFGRLVNAQVGMHIADMTQVPFPHPRFTVAIYGQPETGLLMAVSKEVEGFSLAATSLEEMQTKLPRAVEEFLNFAGFAPGIIKMEEVRKLGTFNPTQFSFEIQPLAA